MILVLPNNDANLPSGFCSTSSSSCLSGVIPGKALPSSLWDHPCCQWVKQGGTGWDLSLFSSQQSLLMKLNPTNKLLTNLDNYHWNITGERKKIIVGVFTGLPIPCKTVLKHFWFSMLFCSTLSHLVLDRWHPSPLIPSRLCFQENGFSNSSFLT